MILRNLNLKNQGGQKMKNEVKAELYIAEKKLNSFMSCCDLRRDSQWYVVSQIVNFSTSLEVNKDYFLKIIEASYKEFIKDSILENAENFWIPAIKHNIKLYVHPTVTEISNGNQSIVISENLK